MKPIFTFSEQEDTDGGIWLIFSLYNGEDFWPIAKMELCQDDEEGPYWSGEVVSYAPEENSILVEPHGTAMLSKAMEDIIFAVKSDYDLDFLNSIGFFGRTKKDLEFFNEWTKAFSELKNLLGE